MTGLTYEQALDAVATLVNNPDSSALNPAALADIVSQTSIAQYDGTTPSTTLLHSGDVGGVKPTGRKQETG